MSPIKFPETFTISWLRETYRYGGLTPRDVVDEIISRSIADREMNIWITPPSIKLIQPYLDRLADVDPADAPLWGIPFAVKDNIDVAAVPTTAGCKEFAYTPKEHASAVARLIEAGAIPVGKTNLDQFATGLVGMRSPFGETYNALRPELISGGSSSGSAVCVARGQAAFALGTDTAGSGRVPAALNRLIGLKPSVGAWPTRGVVPACKSIDCVTVFTNVLEDAWEVDNAVRGLDAEDPWSRDIPFPKDRELPAKICLPKQPPDFYGPYGEAYRDAWGEAVRRLERIGVPIEHVDTALLAETAAILYEGPWIAERWATLGEFIEANRGTSFPVTEQILRAGSDKFHDAASVFQAIHKLEAAKMEGRKLLQNAVLVMPTAGGTWTRDQVRDDPIATNREMGRYTNHCNLLDLSALAIPAGDAAPETPFGITLFAVSGGERLLAELANYYLTDAAAPAITKKAAEPAGKAAKASVLVAVCGLHMRGYPLEGQMRECGARFIREDLTAPKYHLVKLPTNPAKPGLIKQPAGGAAIKLEVWEMPLDTFGLFASEIPAPLGIGKVELQDGTEVSGFICEGYAETAAEDITKYGGWRNSQTQPR